MVTTTSKSISIFLLMVTFQIVYPVKALASTDHSEIQSTKLVKGNDKFKYGQYVYVTLKDGSLTVGKIAGKKNAKKYFVNQLNGSNHGVVHVRYIRKMTKEEIEQYRLSKKKGN